MKKVFILLSLIVSFIYLIGQPISDREIIVGPDGISFKNGEKFIVVESGKSTSEIANYISKNIKKSDHSKNLKIESEDGAIIITDFIPGYTKTDKSSGSAYLLDLYYKIVIDVKDNKYRINVPLIHIAANQKYESDAVIVNKGVQFTVDMGIKGKRDVWNNKEKKMFIYDEKDKLIEKSTKEKLEKDLSKIVGLISSENDNSNW